MSVDDDKMDEVKNVSLALESDETLNLDFPYNDRHALLVVRCLKRKTAVYVVTQTPVRSNYGEFGESDVRYRIDDGKPINSTFSESTDHSAVFAPSPIALAKRLAKASKLLFEFTPWNKGATTATFTLTGLDSVLPQVGGACGWQ